MHLLGRSGSGGRDRTGPNSISHVVLLAPFLAKPVRPFTLKENIEEKKKNIVQVRGAGGGRAVDFLYPAF